MMFARPPEPGANTIVHLASSPQLADVSGGYFYDSRQIEPSPAARDDATAQRLWQESEKIAGFVV
jgi:retinol dehydrogenase-12